MNNFAQFVAALSKHRGREALGIKRTFRTETLTYNQLQKQIYKTAHWLDAQKIHKNDVVMIVAPNMPQWGTLFLACQIMGVVVVPMDVRSSLAAVENIANKVKPKRIFRGRHFLAELDKKHSTAVLDELFDLAKDFPDDPPKRAVSGEDTALIAFTSGTTGEPKGVVLTQTNLLANVRSVASSLKILPRWRFLSILPLSHTYELTVGFLTLLHGGCSVFYVARLAPLAIARALSDHRITSLLAVPQVLTLFKKTIEQRAEHEGKSKVLRATLKIAGGLPTALRRLLFSKVIKQLGGLEFVTTGSAPVDPAVVDFWERLGVKVLQGYGLTETAPVLTMNTFKRRHRISQGRAVPGVSLRIGEQGEIETKGPNVFEQYWHNPKATKAAFTPDGWFKTGDIGELDKQGRLFIRGRAKFVIVLSSGLKVFPEDVERVADKNPVFKAICIVGAQQKEGEAVHAVIITDAAKSKIEKAIEQINQKLESHQQISGWTRWPADDFPRTRLLKTDRKKVWEWAKKHLSGQKAGTEKYLEPPKDKLLELIALVLERPAGKIKETDTLAGLGLDSLKRLTLVSLIEEQMSVSIAEHLITPRTTVAQLRKLIRSGTLVDEGIRRPRWTYWRAIRLLGTVLREALVFPLVRIWVKAEVRGREHVSGLKGPAIFIFNHMDNFDGPVVYRALPLHIRNRLAAAVAEDVMRKHRSISFAARLGFAAFDFARKEPFVPSLDYMARLIDDGWNIAIAPEGRMSKDGQLQPFKSGTGMMAVEMQVPVVPIKTKGLFGTVPLHSRWPKKRSRITVEIGQPLLFAKDMPYAKATAQLEDAMKRL